MLGPFNWHDITYFSKLLMQGNRIVAIKGAEPQLKDAETQ